MFCLFHDISLVHNDVFFLVFYNDFFIYDFHSVELSIFFKTDKKDFGKTTGTDDFEDLKMIQLD